MDKIMIIKKYIFLSFIFLNILCFNYTYADDLKSIDSYLNADTIEYHDEISLMSAIGNVEIINGLNILQADKISYDMKSDKILAIGNVIFQDEDKNKYFSDKMELQGDLKKGIIKNFSALLSDGSRLSANIIIRDSFSGDKLEKITFTRCEPCEDNKDQEPIWQLRALKSQRNIEKGLISYKNVLMDVYGFPVLYIPYISHADPSTKQKSGLLSPKFKSNTILGFSYSQPYYYNLSKNSDLTFTPTMTSNEGPILESEYRELRAKGSTFFNSSITRGSHKNIDGKESNKVRGHIELKMAERINSNWVMGVNATRASDFSYLGRYKIKNVGDTNLIQKGYLRGRYKNLYTDIETLYFQPLDAFKSNRHVPIIFPKIDITWNKNYENGIKRKINLNSAFIAKADASNMQKFSIKGIWSKNKIFESGQIININFSARGDVYNNKITENSRIIGKKGKHTSLRAIPKLSIKWNFPLVDYISNRTILVEPIIQTIIAPKGGNPDTIHNIDSIDYELSDANLFSTNRFAGLDKIEEGSRVNFGIKSNLTLKKYGEFRTLIGRSYSPLKPQEEKIDGTGLNKKLSDIVGRLIYDYKNTINLSYNFRKNALRSQRDSLTLDVASGSISTHVDYTMVRDDPVPTQNLISEQLYLGLTWRVTNGWTSNISQRRDLKNSNFGKATHSKGFIEYKNECIIIRLAADRKHTHLVDIPDTTEISLNFKLIGF